MTTIFDIPKYIGKKVKLAGFTGVIKYASFKQEYINGEQYTALQVRLAEHDRNFNYDDNQELDIEFFDKEK